MAGRTGTSASSIHVAPGLSATHRNVTAVLTSLAAFSYTYAMGMRVCPELMPSSRPERAILTPLARSECSSRSTVSLAGSMATMS